MIAIMITALICWLCCGWCTRALFGTLGAFFCKMIFLLHMMQLLTWLTQNHTKRSGVHTHICLITISMLHGISFMIAITKYYTFCGFKRTKMYYLTTLEVRSLTWVALSKNHSILRGVFFPGGAIRECFFVCSGCWQNSVSCGWRAAVSTSLLAVSWVLYLDFPKLVTRLLHLQNQ